MKLLLESAALDAIRWAFESQLVDGVFVTPRSLDTDAFGIEPVLQVETISRIAKAPAFVALGAVSADDLHKAGREYAKVGDHIVVAVPFVEDGIRALRRLATEGIRTAATFVVTAGQAVLAAKAGATHVCVAVDQLDAHGHDATVVLRETRALFDRHGVECEVVAVAPSSAHLVTTALVSGADSVVVTRATLRALLEHPLTDRALDQLLSDVSKRPRPHGPR